MASHHPAAIAAALAALAACKPPDLQPQGADPTAATKAAREAVPEPLPEFVGVVTSRESKVVTAYFEGRIEKLFIKTGQRVVAGDQVATIDDTQLRDKLAAAQAAEDSAGAELARASVEVRIAKRNLVRESRLYRHNASPRESVASAKAQVSAAGAGAGAASGARRKAKAERLEIEKLLESATLRAPIDGVVTVVKAREGEVAQKGTPIARVFDPRDLMIRFAVPREHRDKVQMGQAVEVRVQGREAPVVATVQTISVELEPPINYTIVEADIDDSKLSAGDELRLTATGKVRLAQAGR
jgi:RND family efflux transporter MFP subunit